MDLHVYKSIETSLRGKKSIINTLARYFSNTVNSLRELGASPIKRCRLVGSTNPTFKILLYCFIRARIFLGLTVLDLLVIEFLEMPLDCRY